MIAVQKQALPFPGMWAARSGRVRMRSSWQSVPAKSTSAFRRCDSPGCASHTSLSLPCFTELRESVASPPCSECMSCDAMAVNIRHSGPVGEPFACPSSARRGHVVLRDAGMWYYATRACGTTRRGHVVLRDAGMWYYATRACGTTRRGHAVLRDAGMWYYATRACGTTRRRHALVACMCDISYLLYTCCCQWHIHGVPSRMRYRRRFRGSACVITTCPSRPVTVPIP
jgi:hypothetical protein